MGHGGMSVRYSILAIAHRCLLLIAVSSELTPESYIILDMVSLVTSAVDYYPVLRTVIVVVVVLVVVGQFVTSTDWHVNVLDEGLIA